MRVISFIIQCKMQRRSSLIGMTSRYIQWIRLRNQALSGICFLILTACSVAPTHSGSDLGIGDAVKTVPVEPGAENNDHPVNISPQVLVSVLDSLTMQPSPGDDDFFGSSRQSLSQPVFKSNQSRSIALELSRKLAAANPGEDVAVRVEQQRASRFVGLKEADITAFRVFFIDGKLNLIFGTLAKDPRAEPGGVAPPPVDAPKRRLNRTANVIAEIGSRTRPGKGPAILLPNDNATPGMANRAGWLQVSNLNSASEPLARTEFQAASIKQNEKSDSTNQSLISTESEVLTSKLKVLKQLRDQDLIGDALYKEKLQDLVDRYLETPLRSEDW